MGDIITIELSSNASAVVAALGRFTPAMQQAIAKALDLENDLSIGHMQAYKLKGPRPDVLGVVSSRLYKSLRASKPSVGETTVESAIGTNVKYAGVHEFGFDGVVQVKAHSRAYKGRDTHQAKVSEVSLADGRIRRRKSVVKSASGVSFVKAHSMRMRMPERSFIRSTIAERTPNYSQAISAAIELAWQGGAT